MRMSLVLDTCERGIVTARTLSPCFTTHEWRVTNPSAGRVWTFSMTIGALPFSDVIWMAGDDSSPVRNRIDAQSVKLGLSSTIRNRDILKNNPRNAVVIFYQLFKEACNRFDNY